MKIPFRAIGLGSLFAFVALAGAFALAPASAGPVNLIGLTGDNTLVLFNSGHPADVRLVKLTRMRGKLLGIDYRPTDGRLYGVTSTNDLYTLDSATGKAALVARLNIAFDGGPRSGVDFNPQTDRLRLVGGNGQNLRAHASLGAAALDSPLTFAPRDRHSGKHPRITASAYTNSVAGATATRLFNIDSDLDALVLQDPPNDGVLTTVGPLGVDFGSQGGFDILREDGGRDRAFAASGSTLYGIDLTKGTATKLGTIGDGRLDLIGLAIPPPAAR